MEKTKAAAIVKRIVTSLILAPVVLWAVYCGSPVINLLALTGGALLAWEWAAMVPNGKASVYGIIYTVSVATAVLTSSAPVIATVILAATLLVWLKAGEEKHRRLLTLGVPYISLGIGSLVWLFNLVGAYTTIWFVLVIWSVPMLKVRNWRRKSARTKPGRGYSEEWCLRLPSASAIRTGWAVSRLIWLLPCSV